VLAMLSTERGSGSGVHARGFHEKEDALTF